MKLYIFSICKDEAETIGELLDRMPKNIKGIDKIERLVISDGSKDDTVKIAKAKGAEVIAGVNQKRLAFRFEQAMDYVLSHGADIAVNIDGDLQFMPEDIPKMVEPILSGEADFVAADRFTDLETGKRRKPKNMPTNKYYANRIGSFIVGLLSGESFRDVTCGFRAYSKKAMLALNLNSEYTYTQESFQVLAMKKMNIKAIPTDVKYYKGRKSRVVTNFLQFMVNSAINILRGFRDFAPLKFFFWLGGIPSLVGVVFSIFTIGYWLTTGSFSPYKFLGFTGLYLFSLGIIIWVVGLVADMLHRVLRNQEKILEKIKGQNIESFKDKK
ncbi:MAG: glycosyltransferase family 2 protein [bacterium]|nr:glycosyltransferase family 2 protein [bacterium]